MSSDSSSTTRSVHFSEQNMIAAVDLQDRIEAGKRWYSKEDYRRFRLESNEHERRLAKLLAVPAVPEEIFIEDELEACVGIECVLSQDLLTCIYTYT
mmetsp:Transcript_11855/g.20600  ORF Transcript_11855/g.20600 Transcript_11855/m.20600 type:complete len:97 (-) Transcript_11855:323-613(-)